MKTGSKTSGTHPNPEPRLPIGNFIMTAVETTVNTTAELEYIYDYSLYYEEHDQDQYAPCDKSHVRAFQRIFLPTLYSILTVLSIAGNLLLAIILLKCTRLRGVASLLLLNMALSDMLFAVTLPFWAVSAHSHWLFGSAGCKTLTAVFTLNLYSSIFFITCMSLEAYLCVVWACNERTARGRRASMCVAVWILACLSAVPSLAFATVEETDGKMQCVYSFGEVHISPWRLFMKFQLNICGFLLPFLAMSFFFLRILCVMPRSGMRKKFKVLWLALLLLGVFFLFWFPYNLMVFLHSLQDLHVLSDCALSANLDFATHFTESLAFVHACLNLLMYAAVNRRFRNELSKILKRMCHRGREYSLECTGSTSPMSAPSPTIVLTTVC
ncbi:atypical chemokine receptor 2 [Scleropages formosus]|uniref:Atypical chemokine receptor 2 n=1 Tax=Scleropages formosus TaxID=113540 RepID=A0A8C9V1K0_SCLFO|nr:atypical chemokine receptor 2-like [Scleropages formosus]